ncbi:MAG: ribonuclease Z [Denitrovibrio sp.]|nr:MAG: ribonuclease Z [Denitrovibrio sp.]
MSLKFNCVASGSSGNCYFLENASNVIFVDVGVPFKRISECVDISQFDGKQIHLFITHEHHDHIAGIKPFINKFAPKVYASEGTTHAISSKGIDTAPFLILECGCEYELDGFSAIPFNISHDSAEPFGYRFSFGEKIVTFATDFGTSTKDLEYFLCCSDLLVLESNYEQEMLDKGPYPKYLQARISSHKGHLSNRDALKVVGSICDTGIRRIFLAHVSDENNDYELLNKYADFCSTNYKIPTEVIHRDSPVTDIDI